MLFTASTVKDTLPNLERFVAGNLAGGVDHLVVFLDAGDAEVEEFLDAHPHVTCVRTDQTWWNGDRPVELNVRQRLNANVLKAVLCGIDAAEWIFHIDADEIVQIDRDVLAAVPASERVVQLATREAVSQRHWDAAPTLFKRLLGKDDLVLLQTLGVIDKAQNGSYFHGHVDGKSGIRPTLDLWLTLHHGVDAEGTQLERYQHEALSVLHYESFSGDDFVRKWTSILQAGPVPHFRPAREPTAVALRTLIDKGLSAEQVSPYLMKIYERTTQDDLTTLRDLGLLVEVDPAAGQHVPQTPPSGALEELRDVLQRLRPAPKRPFHPGRPASEVQSILEAAGASSAKVRAGRSFLRRH